MSGRAIGVVRRAVCCAVATLLLGGCSAHQPTRGETAQPSLSAVEGAVTEAAMAPDGQQVAYVLRVGEQTELRVVDLEGDDRLLLRGSPSLNHIAWMSDGSAVTFLDKRDGDNYAALYIAPLDPEAMQGLAYHLGEVRDLSAGVPEAEPAVRLVYHVSDILDYAFSADGNRLAFLAREADVNGPGPVRVWVAEVEDAERHWGFELPGVASHLVWSPASPLLAVGLAQADASDGEAKLHIVDADTGAIVREIKHAGSLRQAAWSPDGKHLAFIVESEGATAGRPLLVVPATGGEPRALVPELKADTQATAWLDADTVMFLAQQGAATSFGRVDLDGSNQKIIFSLNDSAFSSFSLSADGLSAAFVGTVGAGPSQLHYMKHGDPAPRPLAAAP